MYPTFLSLPNNNVALIPFFNHFLIFLFSPASSIPVYERQRCNCIRKMNCMRWLPKKKPRIRYDKLLLINNHFYVQFFNFNLYIFFTDFPFRSITNDFFFGKRFVRPVIGCTCISRVYSKRQEGIGWGFKDNPPGERGNPGGNEGSHYA